MQILRCVAVVGLVGGCVSTSASAPRRTVAPAADSVQVSTCAMSTVARTATDDACVDKLVTLPGHR